MTKKVQYGLYLLFCRWRFRVSYNEHYYVVITHAHHCTGEGKEGTLVMSDPRTDMDRQSDSDSDLTDRASVWEIIHAHFPD